MPLYKEALTNKIDDDLAGRNDNWTALDRHIDAASVHLATSTPTANRIMMWDAAGRAKAVAPAAADDLARKDTVDAVQTNLNAYAAAQAVVNKIILPRRVGATEDRWYCAGIDNATVLTTGAPTANILRAMPLLIPLGRTLDRIAINVTTLTAGKARLGIYSDNGNCYPNSRVLDAGEVDTGSTGVKAVNINQTLTPGLYWLVMVNNAASTIRALSVGGVMPILGLASDLGTAPGVGWSVAFDYAALPATFTAAAAAITAVPIPAIFVRFSV